MCWNCAIEKSKNKMHEKERVTIQVYDCDECEYAQVCPMAYFEPECPSGET